MIPSLAWRNTWRNKRRSLITAASVVIAVFFVVLVEALNQGVTDYLIDNEIRMYTGHIEINRADYPELRSIEQTMADAGALRARIQSAEGVRATTLRLEMLVLASSGERSSPAILWGIEPGVGQGFFDYTPMVETGGAEAGTLVAGGGLAQRPGAVTLEVDGGHARRTGADTLEVGGGLAQRLGAGTLVVGGGLAQRLGAVAGDSVVVVGQSYRGRTSAGVYPVGGLAVIPIPDLNDHMLFAPIGLVQELADVPGGASSLLVNLHDKDRAEQIRRTLTAMIDTTEYSVRTWEEILGGRLSTHRMRSAGVLILKLILYLIVGFGILGTILLTNNERRREYGMLMALGMKRSRLAAILTAEMLIIALFGVGVGLAVVIPLVNILYFYPIHVGGELAAIMHRFNVEPVLMLSNRPTIFINSALTVFFMTLVIALAATGSVIRLHIASALQGK